MAARRKAESERGEAGEEQGRAEPAGQGRRPHGSTSDGGGMTGRHALPS